MHPTTDPPQVTDDWCEPSRLARLFAATPAMVAYLDPDLRIRMASASWCEWFDCTPETAQRQRYPDLVGDDRFQRHRSFFERARAGSSGVTFEDERIDPIGWSRWCRVTLSPDVAADPRSARGVLMVMIEFTSERARNELIARQREHIYAQVRDRHRNDEVHAELEKMRTLLDWRTAMLAERNDMLHLLSHEIRQPLNNASAAMQATMKAIEDLHLEQNSAAATALARAENVLGQVIGTLDNTLAAGTILAVGDHPVSLSDTDLPTLVQLILADIPPEARTRIGVDWQTDARTVRLHPTLMRLTIRNLLNNALAYSPDDTKVFLRIRETDEPLAIVIDVCDSGSGIPDDLRPRLFEKGARGTNSRMRNGAGLGLFIVRSVAALHRGSVEALPNEGHGTIMRLILPQGLAD